MKKLIIILMALIAYSTHVFAIQFYSWSLINFCRKLCYFLLTEV